MQLVKNFEKFVERSRYCKASTASFRSIHYTRAPHFAVRVRGISAINWRETILLSGAFFGPTMATLSNRSAIVVWKPNFFLGCNWWTRLWLHEVSTRPYNLSSWHCQFATEIVRFQTIGLFFIDQSPNIKIIMESKGIKYKIKKTKKTFYFVYFRNRPNE